MLQKIEMLLKELEEKWLALKTDPPAISRFLADLPPDRWLQIASNPDQCECWAIAKKQQLLLAIAWQSRRSFDDDPLLPLVKAKKITKARYTRVWEFVYLYEAIWDLCQASFSVVREEIGETFPFQSSLEMFFQVLLEHSEFPLLAWLEPYIEYSGGKLEDWIRTAIKHLDGVELPPTARKKLTRLPHASFQTIPGLRWTGIFRGVWEKKATNRNPIIKTRWEAYSKQLKVCLTVLAKQSRRRLPSEAWRAGRRYRGKRGGSYSPDC